MVECCLIKMNESSKKKPREANSHQMGGEAKERRRGEERMRRGWEVCERGVRGGYGAYKMVLGGWRVLYSRSLPPWNCPWSPLPPLRPSTRPRSLSSGETYVCSCTRGPIKARGPRTLDLYHCVYSLGSDQSKYEALKT